MKIVSTSWTLSSPTYEGWEAIEIYSIDGRPAHIESNKAYFTETSQRLDVAASDYISRQWKTASGESWMSLAAVVRNVGEADITGPFRVIIGSWTPDRVTIQQTLDIPETVTIAPGADYTTDFACEQGLVRHVDYTVEVIVDSDHVLPDANRANNTLVRTLPMPLP